jgi:sec-independent protein translocase protein TatA
MQFGWPEIILVVLALVLLFGASRLPQLARSLGQSRKAFKEGMHEAEEEKAASAKRIEEPKSGVSSLSDEEILAEMQRRTESKS